MSLADLEALNISWMHDRSVYRTCLRITVHDQLGKK
jgi:hypothetical protein